MFQKITEIVYENTEKNGVEVEFLSLEETINSHGKGNLLF